MSNQDPSISENQNYLIANSIYNVSQRLDRSFFKVKVCTIYFKNKKGQM